MSKVSLMKGQSWSDRYVGKGDKHKLRFSYPVFVEPKRDEIRARFYLVEDELSGRPSHVEVESYAGKTLHNLGAECEALFPFFMRWSLTEIDCGIDCNSNFNDSYRLVRSSKGKPADLKDAKITVWWYDVPNWDAGYATRFPDMQVILLRSFGVPFLKACLQCVAENEEEVVRYYKQFRYQGFEGAMVKVKDHKYERSRSYSWYKLKPKETYDGRITAINRAVALDGTPHDRAGSISVELEDGSKADPAGLKHDLAADMYANPSDYIGQWVEFEAMERDRQGGYRHPIFIRLRDPKE